MVSVSDPVTIMQLELQRRPPQAANSVSQNHRMVYFPSLPAFHVSINHLTPCEISLPALTASQEDPTDYDMSVGVLP